MTDAAHHARRPRKLVGVVLAAAVALLLPLSVVSTAQGAPGSLATQIVFDLQTVDEPLPSGAPGAVGNLYVVQNKAFTVQLSFTDDHGNPRPLTTGGRTAVTVDYEGQTIASFLVPGGATSTSSQVAEYMFETADVDRQLRAVAATRPTALTDTSEPFDVLLASGTASRTALTSIASLGTSEQPCMATPSDPVCADLVPGAAATAPGLLSLATCRAGFCKGRAIQALIPLKLRTEIYASPATLVMKCDKSLCGVGPIQQQNLEVVITPGSPAAQASACPGKGRVGTNQTFCVDYVQSTRDNAGDTVLYLLFVEDAKVRFL